MFEQMAAEYDIAAERLDARPAPAAQGQSEGASINPMPTTLSK